MTPNDAPYINEMTPEQEAHLSRIKNAFTQLVDAKYRKGQHEHGGNLWEKPVLELLDCAIEEAIDQVSYLQSIRESLS